MHVEMWNKGERDGKDTKKKKKKKREEKKGKAQFAFGLPNLHRLPGPNAIHTDPVTSTSFGQRS